MIGSILVLSKFMEDFKKFHFPSSSKRLVYKKGKGSAVILMHELPGMIPECVDLARRLAEHFTVYLPLLFGEPNQPLSPLKMGQYSASICISHEFYCLAKNQSPRKIRYFTPNLPRRSRDYRR